MSYQPYVNVRRKQWLASGQIKPLAVQEDNTTQVNKPTMSNLTISSWGSCVTSPAFKLEVFVLHYCALECVSYLFLTDVWRGCVSMLSGMLQTNIFTLVPLCFQLVTVVNHWKIQNFFWRYLIGTCTLHLFDGINNATVNWICINIINWSTKIQVRLFKMYAVQ